MGPLKMFRFHKVTLLLALAAAAEAPLAVAADAVKGKNLFKQCAACHALGANAKHKLGPELNNVIGRTAGTAPSYKYSSAMEAKGRAGLVWSEKTLHEYLANPRVLVSGTKMSFAGLKKESDRTDLIAYLEAVSQAAKKSNQASAQATAVESSTERANPEKAPAAGPRTLAASRPIPEHGVYHLGRRAMPEEIRAWNIDVRADGLGLPPGEGSVAKGEQIYSERCAECHGDFGEGQDRWPVLAGGMGTLKADRPVKTIGSYWPYLSTVYDYIRRAQPFGDARSLGDDDVYALTAYVLFLNDLVDGDFTLSTKNFTSIHLPNEGNFIPDTRTEEPQSANNREPCMTNCKPEPAKVIMRARVLDVTPDSKQGKDRPAGSVK